MANYAFSKSSDPLAGRSKSSPFIIGRVKKIVLGKEMADGINDPDYESPKDLGKIRYEILYTNINISRSEEITQPAYPLFSFIRQYPLQSEIVMIVPGPSADLNDGAGRQDYFYFPPYALWNSTNHNSFPNLAEYSKFLASYYNSKEYDNQLNEDEDTPDFPLGLTFSENKNIRSLRPFEGDVILESRFGQSIRFGSTVVGSKNLNKWSNSEEPGQPITIIRNGQGEQSNKDYFEPVVEDINIDDSSIWLTSGHQIHIQDVNQYPFKSFGANIVKNSNVTKIFKIDTSKDYYSPNQTDNISP